MATNFIIILIISVFTQLSASKSHHRQFVINTTNQLSNSQSNPSIALSRSFLLSGGATKKTKNASKKAAIKKSDLISSIKEKLTKIVSYFLSIISSSKKQRSSSKKSDSSSSSKSTSSSSKSSSENRIQKEIKSFMESPPDNCKLVVGSNIRTWVVKITGLEGTIYAGEKFKLKMVFPKDYPSKPPSVFFLKPTPKHVHVYSNGDICLNLLGRDWRPTMTAHALVVSILSMLSNAKEKKSPQDNAMHADAAPGQQQDNWMYHDDRC